MMRFGSRASEMRQMDTHDIFISRLKLLIIMSNAYLEEYPLGEYRKAAVIHNAKAIASEIVDWSGKFNNFRAYNKQTGQMDLDHVFYQRVKLLTVMARAFAEGHPMGYHRKKALKDNVNNICETIMFKNQQMDIPFLKVA